MTDRAALLDVMDKTAQAVSDLGVLLRQQARLLRSEEQTGEQLLSFKAVADQLEVSVKTVRRLVRDGKLGTERIGRQQRVPQTSLDAYRRTRRSA